MKIHEIVLNFCLATSVGCLVASYTLAGYWLIIPALLAMVIFWVAMKKRSLFWSASAFLLIYVALAIVGVTLNLSVYFMVIGCATALACWDLTHFGQSIADNPSENNIFVERYRLQSLALAVFLGLLLAIGSSMLNLRFPFGITMILVLIAMGCLAFGAQYLMKNRGGPVK